MAEAEFTSAEHFNFPRNPKRRTRRNVVSFFLERATRLELASRHPANGSPPFAGTLPHLLIESRLRRGVEAASSPSNEKTGRPTLGVLFHSGAGNEARTRYLHLGKVALYQMSYARRWCPEPESNQRHGDFQSPALPTELSGQIFSAPHGAGGELQPQGGPTRWNPSRGRWRPGTGSNRRPLA